jgi:pyridoxamine 5'-phosphate oxidase
MEPDEVRGGRHDYDAGSLSEDDAGSDPFLQFHRWLDGALATNAPEPYAMALASSDAAGRPSARIVLLRGYDARGFSFFTNYESRKGRELGALADAAALFFWAALQRQIRIEGAVERLAAAESDAYFASRPRGHRLSAWASPQSAEIENREALETRMREMEKRFEGAEIPRPPNWGGFRLVPRRFEFWQGRPNRVHDRILFERVQDGWRRARLAP